MLLILLSIYILYIFFPVISIGIAKNVLPLDIPIKKCISCVCFQLFQKTLHNSHMNCIHCLHSHKEKHHSE